MASWAATLGRAIVSGTVASVTSSLALGALAAMEGKGVLQPVNATSHWRHGEGAADVRTPDLAHTAVGYATHHAATVFWAVFFEAAIARRRPVAPLPMLGYAAAMSAIASAVDYKATPRRFTPGWEFVLTRRSMAAAYGAMAIGLAAGALLTQLRPAARPRQR